jgi:hypothetical protein
MATFLTTRKMSPALAARVEASVSGRRVVRPGIGGARPVGLVAAARFAGTALVLVLVGALIHAWENRRDAFERSRSALLADVERHSLGLSDRDQQLLDRAEAILLAAAAEAPDRVVDPLREPSSLAELLARPAVYVRGDRAAFAASEPPMWAAVKESVKDAFVMCLLDPPATKSEEALLAKVRLAYADGLEARTANVHRLQAVAAGLPLLSRAWMRRVEEADSEAALGELRSAFDRAPIEQAKAAAKAEILIYVLDDPPEPGARVELDGASRHRVHVGIVEIASRRPALRLTTMVDPAWISEDNRFQMARGLDACRLALEVRAR